MKQSRSMFRARICGFAAFLCIAVLPLADSGDLLARMRIITNLPLRPLAKATPAQTVAMNNGYLDVTIGDFGVTGDGVADDTEGLRQAFAFAYRMNLVAYLPQRTYRVSGGFSLHQGVYGGQNGSQRKFANLIVGETAGGRRPVILVSDGSLKAGEILFDYFWADKEGKRDASRQYNSMLRGVDIRMGNNPGAIGVSMDGAQYCVLQFVKISGTFDIGILNLPGSGGGAIEIEIDGGRVGVRQDAFRPNPTLVGFTARNQKEAAVQLTVSRGPLVLSDFDIRSGAASAASYVGIRASSNQLRDPGNTSLLLSNGQITPPRDGVAIEVANRGLLLDKVDLSEGKLLIAGEEMKTGARSETALFFHEKSAASTLWPKDIGKGGGPSPSPKAAARKSYAALFTAGTPIGNPNQFVSLTQFGATPGRGNDDDSGSFAAAFRAVMTPGSPHFGRTVFIPRGHFTVRDQVVVPDGVRLAGASSTISVIEASSGWVPDSDTAILQLAAGDKGIVVRDFAILGRDPSPSRSNERQSRLGLLDVANSAVSWHDIQFARVEFWRDDLMLDVPTYRFRPTAGGYFFTFASDLSHRTTSGGHVGPEHRHLLIEARNTPLVFHAFNIEHGASAPEVELRNAAHVRILGFKFENDLVRGGKFGDPTADGTRPLLGINGSRDITILGGSGNLSLGTGSTLIDVSNSHNVTLGLLDRMPDKRNPRDGEKEAGFSFVTVDGRKIDVGQDVGLVFVP